MMRHPLTKNLRTCLALAVLVAPCAHAQPVAPVPATAPAPTAAITDPATDLKVLPTSSTAAPVDASAIGFHTSMGDSKLSVFFTPTQIQLMRNALTIYESHPTEVKPVVADIKIEKPKIIDPTTYPVFYLSSIVYHSDEDWSIWVSGHKITSQQNKTTLKVLSVSPESATFAWTPGFTQALSIRKSLKLFAPADALKDKMVKPNTIHYDEDKKLVTFTLRTNQSFVVGYFEIFEGFVDSPKLSTLDASMIPDLFGKALAPSPEDPLAAAAAAVSTEAANAKIKAGEEPLKEDTVLNKLKTTPASSRHETDQLLQQPITATH